MNLSDALRTLELGARTLDVAQGRIARRNARQRVTSALRAVRKALDAEYPAIRPEGRERRKPLTWSKKVKQLEARGYESETNAAIMMRITRAGVRGVKISNKHGGPNDLWYFPSWAVTIAEYEPEKLAKVRKSKMQREGLAALLNLKHGNAV